MSGGEGAAPAGPSPGRSPALPRAGRRRARSSGEAPGAALLRPARPGPLGAWPCRCHPAEPLVLQYRTRCRELEQQLAAGGSRHCYAWKKPRAPELPKRMERKAGPLPGRWEATEDQSLEKALLQVEEEQQRCENLAEVNTLLQEHLEEANEVNSALKEDVGKLTVDWMRAREELELKESEWRGERELYDSYLRGERSRLLSLWRQVVTFRCHFLEMKTATDRDLSELKAEQMRLSGSILVNCSRLNCGVRPWEPVTLGRPVLEDQAQQQAEEEISRKTWEVMHLQVEGDPEKKELQDSLVPVPSQTIAFNRTDRKNRLTDRSSCELKDLAALEGEHSLLQSELVVAREMLEESHLQRDLLKQEKHELTVALEKAEQSVAELTGAQNKLTAEIADLHVAAANVSSINEALALDKVQLNKLVLQLEQEHDVLSGKVDEMERAKISGQEKLNLCERTNEALSAEKAHLEQLLKKAEEQQEGLQAELRMLAEEKAETQEKLIEVHRQQESASSGLEQLRQESSRQGQALANVSKEKELLAHEKAALEVRLAATERDRRGLAEQLAEARAGRETLESSLLEAQQRLCQLEIARSQLEIQLQTVRQAKEVIQGEAKCLQCELEAERSLMKQERENMAQQLLRAEEQYNDTLKLRETDHEVEINKLLQELSICIFSLMRMELSFENRDSETRGKSLFFSPHQASEREGHHSELQEMLEQWEKEKAETEREHEKKLFDMKQKVAAMQAQQEEERTRVESAKQEQERDGLRAVKEELVREMKLLQESVTASETRANAATDRNRCLEQELQTTLSILKIKNEEVETQREKIQMLQKEAAQRKALQESLTRMTAILSEREGEMKLYQEQVRRLENQKEMHETTLSEVIKDITEKKQEVESQQEQIRELEKQREMLRTAVSKMSEELEERDREIQFQEGKIMILERDGASQVRNLQVDLDHMKGNLKEKNLELLSLTQQIQALEMEREQAKSLHASLGHLRAVLKDRESECDSQRDQLRLLQQYKEQQEGYLQELRGTLEKMTLSLSEKDQELESQQQQIREAEEVMEMQLRTVRDQLEQTLGTLKEKDRLLDIQKQQARSYAEKTEEQMNVLHRDLEYTTAILKEKDLMIESQKELIETFQKEEQDSGQQKEILQQLQVALKEKEQEMLSLRKQCEAWKEKEEKREAEQTNLQATKLTLKEREEKIEVLEEALSKLQQQKEEAARQTKAVQQKLEYAESSLEARDQEIVSLQEHVQELREQKELEGKQAKSLEQDLDKMSQILKENHLEFLRQTEQMNMFRLREESTKVALTSCQQQVDLLEQAVRKRDEDNETLMQKLQRQEEELKTLQNLQPRLTKKNEEVRHGREQEKLLEEALHEKEQETKAEGELKELEEEVRALREDLQHVQPTLTKKDEEIENHRDRVGYLEQTLTEREQELRRQSELLKQLTSALRWKDGGETLQKQIQKLQKWEEEEAEKRRVLQERDRSLQRQKELTQQLEDERKANGEELERTIAILKQTESREVKWKEKAQALTLALTKSEMANGTLREEIAILQSMVSERDTDRFHHQVGSQAIAEGEQLSWLSEKRLLSQQLECLQRAVARLELEKAELKQLNAELRRTLEQVSVTLSPITNVQVERERRRLKRYHSGRSLPDACGFLLSDQHKMAASRQEESHAHCSRRLAELQNQVSLLQTQLAQERKYKQDYIERCAKTSQELSDLHQELSRSLAAVVREPKAAVLEAEARKLGQPL
ncbi:centrosome-associated protein CEP250-like [Haliaeetus albicilla]|uniref:centrosome-associated protein CEP250-like n=1 Tax=Haliaeetus albicilla TaxID=8969 RepID=UPI0037E829D0